jgi:methylmalonyl-CoA/ethylmalonyl-CoA epimerase
MVLRIDHVSIAVKDYEKAAAFFKNLFGALEGVGAEDSGSMKYKWQLFSMGDMSRLEIIAPTGAGSYLDGFLAKKDAGVHHITLQVENIREAKSDLERQNIPFFGFREYGDYWKELFIHPRDAFGVLIQLAEFRPDDWLPDSVKMKADEKFRVKKTSSGVELSLRNPGGGFVMQNLSAEEARSLAKYLLKNCG